MRLKVRNYQIRTMTRESGRLQALFFEHALQPHIYLAIAGHTDEIEDHLYFTPLTFVFASEQRTDVYKMIEDVEMSPAGVGL